MVVRRAALAGTILVLAGAPSCGMASDLLGGASEDQTSRDAFPVPACIVATGSAAPGAGTLADDTGTATVTASGSGCARTFSLASTAPRRDDLPASPRAIAEQAGRPSVQTTSPIFDALYQLALDEAGEDSVGAIQDYAFNDGAALQCADGGCFETGRKWTYVWTRDTSYASDLGLGWVDPVRAMNSLAFKLSERRGGGGLEIVQDTGTGGSYPISTDRAIWGLGARAILEHLYGDARDRFRDAALAAATNTIEHDLAVVFDPRDGLYRGEQSFLDWREQTYPGWTAADTVHIGMSKSLSTNVAHLALIDLAADLAAEKGDGATADKMRGRASALRDAIRARFWLPGDRLFSTYMTTELDPSPVHRFDLLGTSLAVLLDVATPDQARAAIASYPTLPKGPPVVFPQQKETPIYHNRAIWPFVTAYWAKAARKVGNDAAFDAAIRSLVRGAALNLSNMENLELATGRPFVDDGAYSGPVVNSQRQLWSVAAFIGTVVDGLFGVEAVPGGITVRPFVTAGLHEELFAGATSIALNDLPLRGKTISVVVKLPQGVASTGGAYRIARTTFNGVERAPDTALVRDDELGARNLFEIELAPAGAPGASVRTITDLSDYRSIYSPRTPSVTSLSVDGGHIRVGADFSSENADEITWSVYRDGVSVASGLSASQPSWIDASSDAAASTTHCYSVETRWKSSGNVSQHAEPSCFWGSNSERVASVEAADFAVVGGQRTSAYGRTFYEFWGDPGHEIAATFTATLTGDHLVQAVYGNGAGPTNTGITCGVKHVKVEELPSGSVVGEGFLMMPHRGDWASWGDSSFVRVSLTAGKSYRVRLLQDDSSVNMSAFQHFTAYTGGTGGRSGEFFRVNIAELKLLALGR